MYERKTQMPLVAAANGMYERKTQMPLVYLNLHKAGAASFLQMSSVLTRNAQPAAAATSDVLRDIEHQEDAGAESGMYERKTQLPLVYLNLHKAGAAGFLQKASAESAKMARPVALKAGEVLRDVKADASTEAAGVFDRETQMPLVYLNMHTATQ
eukprot:TRINITY_DN17159_c0_g1_i9.p1 TRINITY_DN17159_c0_g1~~TRINITY_DN17159_c0_g1_i9.p1  ORF type:complete len:155 (+),score=46.99 TRINITY_DN17159_c0_g1_i9:278-742(+)